MTNDWREYNGGPQPVADDVWICIDAMPEEMEEVGAGYARLPKQVGSWKHVTGFFVFNQHLIDAARKEGIHLGLEAAVVEAQKYAEKCRASGHFEVAMSFVTHAEDILALNPDTIAREAVLDHLTREAQEQDMGYDKETAR